MLVLESFPQSPYAEVCLSLFFFLEFKKHILTLKQHLNIKTDAYMFTVYFLDQLGNN